jgi:GTPase
MESQAVSDDIRIAVIGNVDSGKSTLVGVLTKCVQDDGRGSARSLVFNFAHEQANGRTSSIAQEIMGFNQEGMQVVPERVNESKNKTWAPIVEKSKHLITFLDLCGHEKYLKTTIFGLVGLLPDYAMIVLGANMGVTRMTKEHIGLAISLKVPIFFIVTKIDIAPKNVYDSNLELLQKIMRSPAAGSRMPMLVTDENVMELSTLIESKVCPIFAVSNVTGEGIPRLKAFLNSLKTRVNLSGLFGSCESPAEFLIDGIFMVTGIGMVVSGILRSGVLSIGQVLNLGPDSTGSFKPVVIKGIHHKRMPVDRAVTGQSVSLNIKCVAKKEVLKKSSYKKGMVLIDKELCPETVWEFEAEVVILHHATTIKPNYQPIIHCGVVRQAANVIQMSNELLRAGDKGTIRFRFAYRPEIMHSGMHILFREGRTKGLGEIRRIFPLNPS